MYASRSSCPRGPSIYFFILVLFAQCLWAQENWYERGIRERQELDRREQKEFKDKWILYLKGDPLVPGPFKERLVKEATLDFIKGAGPRCQRLSELSAQKRTSIRTQILSPEDQQWRASFEVGIGEVYDPVDGKPGSLWLFHFLHEISHSIDEVLVQATYDLEKINLNDLNRKYKGQDGDLSKEELAHVEAWMGLKLEQGLKAEVRAWVITTLCYRELRAKNLISEIPLAESMSRGAENISHLNANIFNYWDQISINPTTGQFGVPWVARALTKARANLTKKGRVGIPNMDIGQ